MEFLVGDTVKVHPREALKDSTGEKDRTIYWMYLNRIGTVTNITEDFITVALDEKTSWNLFYEDELELVKGVPRPIKVGNYVQVIRDGYYTDNKYYKFKGTVIGIVPEFIFVDVGGYYRPVAFRDYELKVIMDDEVK